jgi:hypothetical protein
MLIQSKNVFGTTEIIRDEILFDAKYVGNTQYVFDVIVVMHETHKREPVWDLAVSTVDDSTNCSSCVF